MKSTMPRHVFPFSVRNGMSFVVRFHIFAVTIFGLTQFGFASSLGSLGLASVKPSACARIMWAV